MIDRQRGKIVFECDTCDEVLETEESNWPNAKAVFDRERWVAMKIADEWSHFCPKCQ